MDVVFTTDSVARAERYAAWRDAICNHYVQVDVKATRPEDYRGFIREGRFGDVVLTDILLSEQRIRRNRQHIARTAKDCCYIQLIHRGNINVIQGGDEHHSNAARGALFSASQPYELQCVGEVRSIYLELPRESFAQRFAGQQIPVSGIINSTGGLGRIATEFCSMLAAEGSGLAEGVRTRLGDQIMDVVALTLESGEHDGAMAEGSVQRARLRAVQRWIEDHLSEPDLNLEKIAAANGISLRYLHLIFQQEEMSASEWLWSRRLQRAYDQLVKGNGRSITAVAFDNGFSSSAHFSTMFRRTFGFSPRDVARASHG